MGDNTSYQDIITYKEQWHLVESNGGVSGSTSQFELHTIVWEFDGEEENLTITNNNTDDSKEDLLDSGTYSFSQNNETDKSYLSINGTEYGEVTFESTGAFTLDGTSLSTGTVSDGYSYEFTRILVEVD
ncbi:hypothetical protein PK35_07445 [Tamlana nanhaiensis]|uniref:Lipocalin-like domain-containing protein n=1 Tax=Neotamlana nanhaiensis TaxID=1382798 RepID=A0A0D7W3N9_9FLAO|nr:hypothetical protein PK35_07445 [Tamlana nanhaiensis]